MIGLSIVLIVAIGIIAFIILRPQPEEPEPEPERYGLRVGWFVSYGTNLENVTYRFLNIDVVNNYPFRVNVTRVELIYIESLPNETLGQIWIEHFTLEPNGTVEYVPTEDGGQIIRYKYMKQLRSDFSPYTNPDEERLKFFFLLQHAQAYYKALVRIEVETETAIYIYYPLEAYIYTKPTTIEEK